MNPHWRRWRYHLLALFAYAVLLRCSTRPLYQRQPLPPIPRPNARNCFLQGIRLLQHTRDLDEAYRVHLTRFDQPLTWDPIKAGYPPGSKNPLPYSGLTMNQVLNANRPAIEALRAGVELPYREPGNHDFFQQFPEYQGYRLLARLSQLYAVRAAGQGDTAAALRYRLDALRMGLLLPRGAGVTGALTGVSVEAIARRGLPELVEQVDAATARAAAGQVLAANAMRVDVERILSQEAEYTCGAVADYFESGLNGELARSSGLHWWEVADEDVLSFRDRRRQMSLIRNYFDELLSQAQKPYRERQDPDWRMWGVATCVTGSSVRGLSLKVAQADAYQQMLAVALALRAYELEQGEYPAQLTALVPEYLHHLPLDPFSDQQPLHYRLTPQSYLLYSVGPDGTDEGGRPIVQYRQPVRHWVDDDSRGDVVWGFCE